MSFKTHSVLAETWLLPLLLVPSIRRRMITWGQRTIQAGKTVSTQVIDTDSDESRGVDAPARYVFTRGDYGPLAIAR